MTQAPTSAPLRIVVALGGNAIVRAGEAGTIEQQFAHAEEATAEIARLARAGHRVLLTHGNGPVVGNIVMRGEAASDTIPPMPLYIAGADSEGGLGLMLQQALQNNLALLGVPGTAVTIVTQTVVDPDDPAFADPDKPIGRYMTALQASQAGQTRGWSVREFPGRGWRRVVASPRPIRIVEADAALRLSESGTIVIAAGGGGVPVTIDDTGRLSGCDAVVDKDWAGALLACAMRADIFAILMESDALYEAWGTPDARVIRDLSAEDAARAAAEGRFERGTVGPKVAAAAHAALTCGCTSILCPSGDLEAALAGRSGTRIMPASVR